MNKKKCTSEEILDKLRDQEKLFEYEYDSLRPNEIMLYFKEGITFEQAKQICSKFEGWKVKLDCSISYYEVFKRNLEENTLVYTKHGMLDNYFSPSDIEQLCGDYTYENVYDYIDELYERFVQTNRSSPFVEEEIKKGKEAIKKYGEDVILIGDTIKDGVILTEKDSSFEYKGYIYTICAKITLIKKE